MTENAHGKGRRLLVEERVNVLEVGPAHFRADLRGDSAKTYRVTFTRANGWTCTCPAVGRCSHLVACQLIVVVHTEDGSDRTSEIGAT